MEETGVDTNEILINSTPKQKSCNCNALQIQLDSLERKLSEYQANFTKRILAIESILLDRFGTAAVANGEIKNILDLLEQDEIRLNSFRKMNTRRNRTSRSRVTKLFPESTPREAFWKRSTVTGTGTFPVKSEDSKSKRDIVKTRSGRLSKPNPKFEHSKLKVEEGSDETETDEHNESSSSEFEEEQQVENDVPGSSQSGIRNPSSRRQKSLISSRYWKFTCEFCNKKFPTEFKRNYHTKMHTENRPFKCEVPGCEVGFKFKTQLNIHSRVHQSTRKYSCTVCGRSYKHKGGLGIHMLVHKQLRIYGCVLCEKRFYTKTHVKRHLLQIHKCRDTNIDIPKDTSLLPPPIPKKKKIVQRRPRTAEKVICDQCGACVLRNNFKHHLTTHDILFSCDQCGRGFSTEFALKSHIDHAHDLDKPFLCNYPECESRFSAISNLKTHQISHTEERRYRCEPCNRSYKHKGGLKVHINSCHSKDKQYPCVVCSRVFDTRTHLKRHMMRVHNIDKDEVEEMTKVKKEPKAIKVRPRLFCDLCPKTYKNKYDLSLHQNAAHTKKIKFPCQYCNRVFYRRNHQMRHLQKVHNIEQPTDHNSSELQGKMQEIDMSTVDLEFDEIPSSSVVIDPVYEGFQLKPGTVVEIFEYDGTEIRHVEEVTS